MKLIVLKRYKLESFFFHFFYLITLMQQYTSSMILNRLWRCNFRVTQGNFLGNPEQSWCCFVSSLYKWSHIVENVHIFIYLFKRINYLSEAAQKQQLGISSSLIKKQLRISKVLFIFRAPGNRSFFHMTRRKSETYGRWSIGWT